MKASPLLLLIGLPARVMPKSSLVLLINAVTDDEILEAYYLLAASAGVFVEPASAASVAGVIKLARAEYFKGHKGERLVCTLTGHGLKDPKTAMQELAQPQVLKADKKAILKLIGL